MSAIIVSVLTALLRPFSNISSAVKKNPDRKFRFFTAYQAAVIADIVSLIIPADDQPGAREAGVVYELDMLVLNAARSQRLYRNGIKWFDSMSAAIYNEKKFIALPEEAKYDLLKRAESGRQGLDNADIISGKRVSLSEAESFVRLIKRQTFEVFYTSKTGWELVGYQGPPQWAGNRKYYQCD